MTPDATSVYAISKNSGIITLSPEPSNVTLRYNSIYLTAPIDDSRGVWLNANASDPLLGVNHNIYGNLIVFGNTATALTACLATENITISQFTVKDYNACYYLGATSPKWQDTSTLATIQAAADANRSELNSVLAATTSVTIDQPYFVSPTTSPQIGTLSAAKNSGHPTLGPKTAWPGYLRNQGVKDKGAYEFGATTVVPNSPSRMGAQ